MGKLTWILCSSFDKSGAVEVDAFVSSEGAVFLVFFVIPEGTSTVIVEMKEYC